MDEKHFAVRVKAPGRQGSGMQVRLPGREQHFPRVDDHLVQPEVTRDEIIGGVRLVASPASPSHAFQQGDLDFVLRAHATAGYRLGVDLLTRHDEESDFATDSSLVRDGIDPATGARYLEELAFEVVSEQSERHVTEKAVRMCRRGVRRIFAIWVKGKRRVCEWSPETQSWCPLAPEAQIEDACLVKPMPVAALLDAALAENAVMETMVVKGNPVLRRREAEAAKAERERAETAEAVAKTERERAEAAEAVAKAERERAEAERQRADDAEAELKRLRSLLADRLP
jgi:hypothetical protein